MKAEEKQILYNLLKTADAYECGYTRDKFTAEPEFTDDTEKPSAGAVTSAAAVETVKAVEAVEKNSVSPLSGGITLDELNTKILRCTRCGLARTRNNVVPGMGVESPDVLVIGEGPGHDEDMQGLPFVGKAGVLLDRMLAAIELDRKTNCYIANIVKCRPPENRNPFPDEQAACFSFLETQIHILKPKMILCMGKIAIEKILGQEIAIT
ncbi:MAG: uracil-DNA glycosylase, partial [Treponema sp.]|nr:uracil-DNA glycosylase [Treponema sp.]